MRFLVMAMNGPTAESAARMLEYSKSLQKAGVLLARDELFPPSTGARISFTDGRPTVTNGPFVPSKELLGGYWILQVRSREEAIEWAKRAPLSGDEAIEVLQIREM
ncbi:MAG: YciI family protein [Acidobacteria bacterium]|nr:YciI family protein [Acidobacteriota bacterium]